MFHPSVSAHPGRSKHLCALAVGVLALSSVAASAIAQEPAATPSSPAPAATAPTPAECGISGHHALLERMSEAFVLTCPQEQKLEPLLHDEESVSKPLLGFAAFTPEEKKDVMTQVKVAARKQIRPLLTPEQQERVYTRMATGGQRKSLQRSALYSPAQRSQQRPGRGHETRPCLQWPTCTSHPGRMVRPELLPNQPGYLCLR